MAQLRKKKLFCYGFLAWPMAFIGICLFVYIPKIYHEQYGLTLYTIGVIFLLTKIANLSMLPFFGIWLDRLSLAKVYRKKIIYLCLPFMALFFHFLIFPPVDSMISTIFFYIVTCALYSAVAINYYAISVEMTRDYRAQNQVAGVREMFTLLGFLTATIFPTILTDKYSFREAYNDFIFVFMIMLFTAGVLLHFVKSKPTFTFHSELNLGKVFAIARSSKHSKFLMVIFLNAISQGLITTGVLVYIKYVIDAGPMAGYLLMIYYLSAIVAVPFWVRFSSRNGKKNAWIIAMTLSSFFFALSFFLGTGDVLEYAVICIATGVCSGADAFLSPSLYSDNVERQEKASIYYSLWLLVNKFAMTICMIASLSILGFSGLEANTLINSDSYDQGMNLLSVMFCLIPAIFKLLALSILFITRVDIKFLDDEEHHHRTTFSGRVA